MNRYIGDDWLVLIFQIAVKQDTQLPLENFPPSKF